MTWVVFTSRSAFDTYHDEVCAAHGIPYPGYQQLSNEPQIMTQWTNAWVDIYGAFVASPNSYLLVSVPDEDVITYGLTLSQNAPVVNPSTGQRTIIWDGVSRTIFTQVEDWRQPKPATWTDPNTNITYDTTTGEPI